MHGLSPPDESASLLSQVCYDPPKGAWGYRHKSPPVSFSCAQSTEGVKRDNDSLPRLWFCQSAGGGVMFHIIGHLIFGLIVGLVQLGGKEWPFSHRAKDAVGWQRILRT